MQTLVEILAFIGGGAVAVGVFAAVASFVEFLQHTRKLADDSVEKCRSLESMDLHIGSHIDRLARDVALLKETLAPKDTSRE